VTLFVSVEKFTRLGAEVMSVTDENLLLQHLPQHSTCAQLHPTRKTNQSLQF